MRRRKEHRDGKKHCARCDQWLPPSEFHKARRRWDGLKVYCKPCDKASYAERGVRGWGTAKLVPSPYPSSTKEGRKCRTLQRRYGITLNQFNELHEIQGGRCAICNRKRRLLVDHCHATGRVRGLLCFSCNHALGVFDESAAMMARALRYAQTADALGVLERKSAA